MQKIFVKANGCLSKTYILHAEGRCIKLAASILKLGAAYIPTTSSVARIFIPVFVKI